MRRSRASGALESSIDDFGKPYNEAFLRARGARFERQGPREPRRAHGECRRDRIEAPRIKKAPKRRIAHSAGATAHGVPAAGGTELSRRSESGKRAAERHHHGAEPISVTSASVDTRGHRTAILGIAEVI